MEAVNGVPDVAADKGNPPPPSPLTGCYLLIVIGEPHGTNHKDIILQRVAKGLLSWDLNNCLVDLEKELAILTEQGLEGEEARYGERLIQFASENLVTEILIHPVVSTLAQCVRNLLSSFTRHRHIIHAGYTFASNGSWVLQDGTFSLTDFSEAFQEIEVLRVVRAYENGISLDIHCSPEGDWLRLPKEPFAKGCNLRVNPNDVLTSGSPAIASFLNYLDPFLVPADLDHILESSDVVGNIRFSRPTLYVFPGGQGDAALFGINGFNMLLDGGFSRKACFWDFVRHLDRLDAVLLTRLNNSNVNGISAVLRRKRQNALYPQIGHFFCNIQERKAVLSPDGDKDKDPLLIDLLDEGQDIVSNLKHLALTPQVCYRDSEPINLYHKVGHGTLDMYVLSPAKDSKEVREFLQKWNNNDQKLFASQKSKDFAFPLQNLVSVCALLVWQPANPEDTITRILFPGSSPQSKIFEGLDRVKSLEFIKHPVCSDKTLAPTAVIKTKTTKESVMDKIMPPRIPVDNKKEKAKQTDNVLNENELKNGDISDVPADKTVKKSDSTESEKSISKPKKILENGDKAKPKPTGRAEPKAKLQQKRVKPPEKKPSPKRSVDRINEEAKDLKPKTKASPSATPAKSTKEANNRKVVESKTRSLPKKEPPAKPPADKKEVKVERKPISRRPKETAAKLAASPSKKVNGVPKPDTFTKRGKLDKEGTTDSSTVSTPSADQDSVLKKDISKMTSDELQNLKAKELAELKEEQEAVKEIEAVFRKGELHEDKSSDFRKIKDLSIDDKLESEEYLIIEKTELVQEVNEDETQKHARDSEESEKQRKLSAEIEKQIQDLVEDKQEPEKVSAAGAAVKKDEVDASKEASATSPEDRVDLSTDKKTTDKDNEDEIKEAAPESQPDEKGSANIESGATTTAPTLPEDERIPLDEIKEMENGDHAIEEKHVKEDTKERDVPVIQLPPKTFENITKLPPVVGIRLDKQSHIRDIVKTPDEVADLPVHEEVDIDHYADYAAVPDTKPGEAKDDEEEDGKPAPKSDEVRDPPKHETVPVETKPEAVQEALAEEPKETAAQEEKVAKTEATPKLEETDAKAEEPQLAVETDEDGAKKEGKTEEVKPDVDSKDDVERPEKEAQPAEDNKLELEVMRKPDESAKVEDKQDEVETTGEPDRDQVAVPPTKAEDDAKTDDKDGEIIEKSETEVKEKECKQSSTDARTEQTRKLDEGYKSIVDDFDEDFDREQFPDSPRLPELDLNQAEQLSEADQQLADDNIKIVKETNAGLEKIDEKLQQLKLKEELKRVQSLHEIVALDHKMEELQHAEPVIITDSKPDSPATEDKVLFDIEDKLELGRKSPKEREEDVAKIVAGVAVVLKSDAPLEEFEGKIPLAVPYKPYTTELRETHITTVESPVADDKSATASFLEQERKMVPVQEEPEEKTESKISKMIKDSNELMQATSKIISDIKHQQEPSDQEDPDEPPTVHRMLVTASSEDGGEETEICPPGTIVFSRSSESSGRSSPDPLSQKLSQKSSIADTLSDTITTKTVRDLQSGKDSGIDEDPKTSDIDSKVHTPVDKPAETGDKSAESKTVIEDIKPELKKDQDPLSKATESTDSIEQNIQGAKTTTADKARTLAEEPKLEAEKDTDLVIKAATITIADQAKTAIDEAKVEAQKDQELMSKAAESAISEILEEQIEHKVEDATVPEETKPEIQKDKDLIVEAAQSTVSEITKDAKHLEERIDEGTDSATTTIADTAKTALEEVKVEAQKDQKLLSKAAEGATSEITKTVHHPEEQTEHKVEDATVTEETKPEIQKDKDLVKAAESTVSEIQKEAKDLEELIEEGADSAKTAIADKARTAIDEAKLEVEKDQDLISKATEGAISAIAEKAEAVIDEAKLEIQKDKDIITEAAGSALSEITKEVHHLEDSLQKTTISDKAETALQDTKLELEKDQEIVMKAAESAVSEITKEVHHLEESIGHKVEDAKHTIADKADSVLEEAKLELEKDQDIIIKAAESAVSEITKEVHHLEDKVEDAKHTIADKADSVLEEAKLELEKDEDIIIKAAESAVSEITKARHAIADKAETVLERTKNEIEKDKDLVVKAAESELSEITKDVRLLEEEIGHKVEDAKHTLESAKTAAADKAQAVLEETKLELEKDKDVITKAAESAVSEIAKEVHHLEESIGHKVEDAKHSVADKAETVLEEVKLELEKDEDIITKAAGSAVSEITKEVHHLEELLGHKVEDAKHTIADKAETVLEEAKLELEKDEDVITKAAESAVSEITKEVHHLEESISHKVQDAKYSVADKAQTVLEKTKHEIEKDKDLVVEAAESAVSEIAKEVHHLEESLGHKLEEAKHTMADKADSVLKEAKLELEKDEDIIMKAAESAVSEIAKEVHHLKESIGHKVEDAEHSVADKAQTVLEKTKHEIENDKDLVIEGAESAVSEITKEVHHLEESIGHKVEDAKHAIADTAETVLELETKHKIEKDKDLVAEAAESEISEITKGVRLLEEEIGRKVEDTKHTIADKAETAMEEAKILAQKLEDTEVFEVSKKIASETVEELKEVGQEVKDKTGALFGALRDTAGDVKDAISDQVDKIKETVMGEEIADEEVNQTVEKEVTKESSDLLGVIKSTATDVKDSISDKLDQMTEKETTTKQKVDPKIDDIKKVEDKVTEKGGTLRESLADQVEQTKEKADADHKVANIETTAVQVVDQVEDDAKKVVDMVEDQNQKTQSQDGEREQAEERKEQKIKDDLNLETMEAAKVEESIEQKEHELTSMMDTVKDSDDQLETKAKAEESMEQKVHELTSMMGQIEHATKDRHDLLHKAELAESSTSDQVKTKQQKDDQYNLYNGLEEVGELLVDVVTADREDPRKLSVSEKPGLLDELEAALEEAVEDVEELIEESKEAVASIFKSDAIKKEETVLEKAADDIEKNYDVLTDMTKSVVFEKCEPSAEGVLERAADDIERNFDIVCDMSKSVVFDRCDLGHDQATKSQPVEEKIVKTEAKQDGDSKVVQDDKAEATKTDKDAVKDGQRKDDKVETGKDQEATKTEKDDVIDWKKAAEIDKTDEPRRDDVEKEAATNSADLREITKTEDSAKTESTKMEKDALSDKAKEESIAKEASTNDKSEQDQPKLDGTGHRVQISGESPAVEDPIEKGTELVTDAKQAISAILKPEKSHLKNEDEALKETDMTKSAIFDQIQSGGGTTTGKIASDFDTVTDMSQSVILDKEAKIEDFVGKTAHDLEDNFQKVTDMSRSIIFETCPTKLGVEETPKKLSISEVEVSVLPQVEAFIEQERMLCGHPPPQVAGPSSDPKDQISTPLKTSDEPSLSGKSTPDIAEVERIKEIQETLKHEKHIPGSSTPPTVPVSPIVKDVLSKGETKTSVASLKEADFRSCTPGSDDLDISSGQVSRVVLETQESDDDEIPGSPMSMTSQVAHSRSSSHYDFEDDRMAGKVDAMQASFYGALPDDLDGDREFQKAVMEHKEARGEDLVGAVAPTYLYEITKAKYSTGTSAEDKDNDNVTTSERDLDQINKNGQGTRPGQRQDDVMTSSFYGGDGGELPSSWGKPLKLPSPAPPTDNRGTPKKERRLPANVTAKNKLNDDRKRSESPSKYKNRKLAPVYVDLTYVPHHGNAYYSYVDFFKKVRARYYVFSGIEPSREVYNALLEAKQTWEDKELEVTIIPTYDTDILGYWVAENEELLTKYKIDLSPSASRCTINLQDHETSCSAYRLEF